MILGERKETVFLLVDPFLPSSSSAGLFLKRARSSTRKSPGLLCLAALGFLNLEAAFLTISFLTGGLLAYISILSSKVSTQSICLQKKILKN